ncbi:P pilus assembly protein, pilin FimA [Serratia marcescens]|uniref:fimbrial protein n=1 Tax=Serratia TaxID=613 RepID=UPI00074552F1|nr:MULTISPECIES: fimbrial protein [Serratia]AVE51390.1 P pilus assembly protein, pilin FimA [Serratia marcescens]EMD6649137.1 fimbrial protein [Serratia marcescens]MBD8462416.1 fimbrial protein [Serratia marcescens]MBH2976105.1 fimbrial protein [Serratia marcescens]MBH2980719.1 fimbrial protein [Serratia marcescens]
MCKTYSPYVLLSALLFLLVSEAQAFTCKSSDGGVIPEGGSNTPVPLRVKIGPNLVNGKNELSSLSQISCKNESWSTGWWDEMRLKTVLVVKPELYPFTVGVKLEFSSYDIPGNRLDLDKLVLAMGGGHGGSPFYRVPISLYIKVGKNPSQDVFIQKGDVLVRFYMEQSNNQPGCPLCGPYIWDVVADNDAYFATTSCTINKAKQMNVDFGPISQDNFTTSVDSAVVKQNQNLDYYCEGSNASQDIAVRLVGNTSGFSSEAIQTSNANIGIAMLYKGKVIKPNEIFNSKIVNGMGSDTLTFVPIKKNVPFNEINTGPFSGSATLVFSVP